VNTNCTALRVDTAYISRAAAPR
jgi:hypothetical protein